MTARLRSFLPVLSGVLGAAAMVAVAAAPAQAVGAFGDHGTSATQPPVGIGGSWSGNYLAARHAQSRHDFAAAADFLDAALADTPEAPALLPGLHLARVLDGRIDAAAAVAERLVSLAADSAEPADPFAQLTLAVAALRDGDTGTAERLAAALPDTPIHRVLRPVIRGWAFLAEDRLDDAMAAIEPLSWNERTMPFYHFHAALLNDAADRTEAARDHFLKAAEDDAVPSLRLVQILAQFHQRTGDSTAADALIDRFLDEQPDRRDYLTRERKALAAGRPLPREIATAGDGVAEAMFGVASALSRQESRQTALALAHYGLALRPDFASLRVLAAGLMESFDRHQEANALYDTVAPDSSLHWHARVSQASNLNRMDRVDAAEAALRALSAERPDRAEPMMELGDILRSRERYREAVDAYDSAVARLPAVGPEHWTLLYARGIALERSSMWPRAEADFLKALEFQPDQPYVLNYLGYSWLEQGRNLEQALEMIERAVAARPNDGFIVDSLGWAHYKLGNFDRAVRELERAVSLRPQDPVINDHLGDAYWRVGRVREARLQWRAALARNPEPDIRMEIERKLADGLGDDPTEATAERTSDQAHSDR